MDINLMNLDLTEAKRLLPQRIESGTKYDHGKVSGVCGSRCYRGAASLAMGAAARAGAGLIDLASIEPVIAAVASILPECTFLPVAESQYGGIAASASPSIVKNMQNATAALCGCGMTASPDTAKIVCDILECCALPLVLDADALNALAQDISPLESKKAPVVITPHVREMARLTGLSIGQIKYSPLEAAVNAAREYNVTVVLKDSSTVIAAPNGDAYVFSRENSGLAKGGSGDALAGIVAGLLAQGAAPFEAAACGVFIHSLAGFLARAALSPYGMLPSDVVNYIPAAMKTLWDS